GVHGLRGPSRPPRVVLSSSWLPQGPPPLIALAAGAVVSFFLLMLLLYRDGVSGKTGPRERSIPNRPAKRMVRALCLRGASAYERRNRSQHHRSCLQPR